MIYLYVKKYNRNTTDALILYSVAIFETIELDVLPNPPGLHVNHF